MNIEREQEIKFAADDTLELGDLSRAVPGAALRPPVGRHLVATYYDTLDLRLAAWGCSVRERNDAGWVVKLPVPGTGPAAGVVRDEVHIEPDGSMPPAEAVRLVAPLSGASHLAPIATVTTDRTAFVFTNNDDAPAAELVDDRVVVTDGFGVTRPFRELELELIDPATDLSPLLDRLTTSGFRPIEGTSKLSRGLGRTVPPPAVEVPRVSEWPTGREVTYAAIASAVRHLLLHLPHARVGAVVGVHQSRVSIRRLRSDLKTFRTLLDPAWAAPTLDELRWLGALLGQVRDDDVLVARLAALPAAEPLVPIYERQRTAHRAELIDGLDTPRTDALLATLVAAAHDPPTTPQADDPAPDLLRATVAARWRRLRRAVDALGARPSDTELHEVRILAKRCRYALEAVAPAFGSDAGSRAKAMARLQDALGELNDAAVISARLGTSDEFTPSQAFAAGLVVGSIAASADHDRDAWRPVWAKVSDGAQWRWL